jgi:hypothetical protein
MGEGGASFREGSFLWTALVLSTWETVAENSILQQNGRRFTLAHRMGEGRVRVLGTSTFLH